MVCDRCEGSTAVGQYAAEVCGHADNHRLHQDTADVLHIAHCHHGRAGGTQAGHLEK